MSYDFFWGFKSGEHHCWRCIFPQLVFSVSCHYWGSSMNSNSLHRRIMQKLHWCCSTITFFLLYTVANYLYISQCSKLSWHVHLAMNKHPDTSEWPAYSQVCSIQMRRRTQPIFTQYNYQTCYAHINFVNQILFITHASSPGAGTQERILLTTWQNHCHAHQLRRNRYAWFRSHTCPSILFMDFIAGK